MFEDLHLFPEAASEAAGQIDALYFFLIGLTAFFVTLISAAVIVLSLRYRRRAGVAAEPLHGSLALELTWTGIPLVIVLFVFAWAARLYFEVVTPPDGAMQFYVTGKQWMWKVQHPTGQREINALHVPAGQVCEMVMTSEDVIHSFYIPAFRVKRDVVPGRYTRFAFTPSKVGVYHLFCAEYCGTKHSEMIGSVIVMEPAEYELWLSGQTADQTPAEAGEALFASLRCDSCHAAGDGQRGPSLVGRFGGRAELADGRTLDFDADYVRESILTPRRKLAAGYQPVMPTYEGQVTEGQILQLIAYIQGLADPNTAPAGTGTEEAGR